jgi:Mrp family chromosome partitioning ATPase
MSMNLPLDARGGLTPARHAARSLVMVTSPGQESSLGDVALNLAKVCAETGQRVALVSTSGLAEPADAELPQTTPLWWKNWPSPRSGDAAAPSTNGRDATLVSGPLSPDDVNDLLGETSVPGVSRLDMRYFVGHPAQVVIRMPDVLVALRQLVDVVILEVPSYLSVHHGEGLTPLVDVVLVVAERQLTRLDEARRTSAALKRLGAPVVGMALTDGPPVESFVWDVDSELEAADEASSRHTTEELPVVEPADVARATPQNDGFVVHHPLPGA